MKSAIPVEFESQTRSVDYMENLEVAVFLQGKNATGQVPCSWNVVENLGVKKGEEPEEDWQKYLAVCQKLP